MNNTNRDKQQKTPGANRNPQGQAGHAVQKNQSKSGSSQGGSNFGQGRDRDNAMETSSNPQRSAGNPSEDTSLRSEQAKN